MLGILLLAVLSIIDYLHQRLCLVHAEADLLKNLGSLLGIDALVVLLARGDDEACHIEGTRGYHEVSVAIGTMLPAREDEGDVLIIKTP